MIYSKTLHPMDYDYLTVEKMKLAEVGRMLGTVQHRFEHKHRAWEYGMVMSAISQVEGERILDVGGGGSVFAVAEAGRGYNTVQVDPGDVGSWIERQSSLLTDPSTLRHIQKDFMALNAEELEWKPDFVTCISVLEHVPDDTPFFLKLLDFVSDGGLLALTVDFHPSGESMVGGHIRTYNQEALYRMYQLAKERGFEWFVTKPRHLLEDRSREKFDYAYFDTHVNNYNFASLILRRETSSEKK